MARLERLIPLLLAVAVCGVLVLLTPNEVTAQGTCAQCFTSPDTHCKMCRFWTETGQDDCTTPSCNECGDAGDCNPTVTAIGERAASETIEDIRARMSHRLGAEDVQATGVTFATTLTPSREPAGIVAAIRKELGAHNLYLSADGSVRTCDGTQVGRIPLPGSGRAKSAFPGEVARTGMMDSAHSLHLTSRVAVRHASQQ